MLEDIAVIPIPWMPPLAAAYRPCDALETIWPPFYLCIVLWGVPRSPQSTSSFLCQALLHDRGPVHGVGMLYAGLIGLTFPLHYSDGLAQETFGMLWICWEKATHQVAVSVFSSPFYWAGRDSSPVKRHLPLRRGGARHVGVR